MVQIKLAEPVQKKIKILLYGTSGSGKTIAALSFPRVLLVDAESGSELYRGRPGINPFHVADCKTISDLEDVVRQFAADNGKTWDTLVIDPISVFYAVEKNVASQNNSKDIDMRGWNKINGRMNAIYTRLTSLNGHVVIIARETTEYSGEGLNLKKVGVKPDADKNLVYMMDFVIHMTSDHAGQVEKSRGVDMGTLPTVSWDVFKRVAEPFQIGQAVKHESDEEAAERELDSLSTKETAESFWKWCVEVKGLTKTDILAALKIQEKLSEWTEGREQAEKAIEAYIAKQLEDKKPATPKANASATYGGKPAQPTSPKTVIPETVKTELIERVDIPQ